MADWLYSANPKLYKVMSAFKEETVAWPVNSKVNVGDTVYIYLTAPHKKLGFVCSIIQKDIPENMISEYTEPYLIAATNSQKPKAKPFMLLGNTQSMLEGYGDTLTLENLKANGLNGMLMGPRKLDNNPELLKYIKRVSHEICRS